ncbi:MAG: chemoreceptor glutamine deamidase CheD [Pseudomonadota bacterium]
MSGTLSQRQSATEEGQAHFFVDKKSGQRIAKVLPGDFYVTTEDTAIATVLGSCISACMRDPDAGVGGINHFMLPSGTEARAENWGSGSSAMNRFGNFAMEALVNSIIKLGGRKHCLEVKLFGGGRVLDIASDVGKTNIAFVEDYVTAEGLRVVSKDVGADYARKILYDPLTGRVRLRRLRDSYVEFVASKERELLQKKQETPPQSGELELF